MKSLHGSVRLAQAEQSAGIEVFHMHSTDWLRSFLQSQLAGLEPPPHSSQLLVKLCSRCEANFAKNKERLPVQVPRYLYKLGESRMRDCWEKMNRHQKVGRERQLADPKVVVLQNHR